MVTKQKMPNTPLPDPGQHDGAAHVQMSKRFQEHTSIEVSKGNRLQASEKVWASVSHAVKAVAERRGWRHNGHGLMKDVAVQLGKEQGKASVYRKHIKVAEGMHQNFYENREDWDDIEDARKDGEQFIAMLTRDRTRAPGKFTVASDSDQRRLGRLLGIKLPKDSEAAQRELDYLFPIGTTSDKGFSPALGYLVPRKENSKRGMALKPAGKCKGQRTRGKVLTQESLDKGRR